MTDSPRVRAHYEVPAVTSQSLCSDSPDQTPEVEVSVTFTLGEHKVALSVLETAVAKVLQQIDEVAAQEAS